MGKDSWILEAVKGSKFGLKLSAIKKFLFERSKIDDLTKCMLCPNMCRFACPISIVGGRETTSPAGKARIAYLLREGYIEETNENVLPLYYCLSCDICKNWCVFGFSVGDLIRPIRKELYLKEIYPQELVSIVENLKQRGIPYDVPSMEGKEGDILYLWGCYTRKYTPEIGETTIKFFEHMGYKIKIINNEPCCGYLAYELGDEKLFLKIANKNAQLLNKMQVKAIITSCPICAYTYRKLYPKYKIEIKHDVYHVSEFIKMNIDKLNFHETNIKVTVHDSPKLTIGLDQPDIIREILMSIPGVEVMLPMRYGKNTFPCGNEGGLLDFVDKDLSIEITSERLRELKEEADITITTSPRCKHAFSSLGANALDLVEFLFKVMEEDAD